MRWRHAACPWSELEATRYWLIELEKSVAMMDEEGYDWRSVPGYRKQRDDVRDELERLERERTDGRLTLCVGGEV